MISPATLADGVLIVHVLFVGVVVLSVPLIIVGGLCSWRWVRSPWFRFTHLGMIAFVAAESLASVRCPLTVWENKLRDAAGQQGYEGDFIATWLDRLLFYHLPLSFFTVIYVGFALLVASLFYFVPVRRRRVNDSSSASGAAGAASHVP